MTDPVPANIPAEHYTPNAVVSDPRVRKIVGTVLSVATLVLSITTAVDVAIPAMDLSWITGPAALISASIFGIFQLAVTNPNVPSA